jgi:hypothetical protein
MLNNCFLFFWWIICYLIVWIGCLFVMWLAIYLVGCVIGEMYIKINRAKGDTDSLDVCG